jgi:tetratricopeptide (TPR) repeat protein
MKRIATLKAKDRFILTVMSFLGREFYIDPVLALFSKPCSISSLAMLAKDIREEDIVRAFDNALLHNFISAAGHENNRYSFVHDAIIEALQGAYEPEILVAMNCFIAQEEARIYENGDRSVLFSLANHALASKNADLIIMYAQEAGKAALERFAYTDAKRLFSAVLQALDRRPDEFIGTRQAVKKALAEAWIMAGDYDNAIRAFLDLLDDEDEVLKRANIHRHLCLAFFKKGAWAEVEQHAKKGLHLLGEKLPVNKISLLSSFGYECIRFLLSPIKAGTLKRTREGGQAAIDRLIIQFYVTLNWSYSLSNVARFSRSVLRMINLSKRRIGLSNELAISLSAFACLLMMAHFFKKAAKYHHLSLAMQKELDHTWGIGQSLQWLGYLHQWKGEYDVSNDYFNSAIKAFAETGDIWEQGMSVHGLDLNYLYRGEYDRARDCVMMFLRISDDSGDTAGVCGAYDDLLWMNAEQGLLKEAREYGMKSMALSCASNLPFHACINNNHMGTLCIVEGEYDEAIGFLQKAKTRNRSRRFIGQYVAQLYPDLAEAYIMKHLRPGGSGWGFLIKKIKARVHCWVAMKKTAPWLTHHGDALRAYALYYRYCGKAEKSERFFRACIDLQKSLNRRYKLARVFLDYGLFLSTLGRDVESRVQINNAGRIFSEIGCELFREKALQGLRDPRTDNIALGMRDRMGMLKYEKAMTLSHEIQTIHNRLELLAFMLKRCMELSGARRGFYFNAGCSAADEQRQPEYTETMEDAHEKPPQYEIMEQTLLGSGALMGVGGDAEYSTSFICLPVLSGGSVIGACYFDNMLTAGLFNESDRDLLSALIAQAAPLIAATDSHTFIASGHPHDPGISPDARETLGLSVKEDGRYHIIPFAHITHIMSRGRHVIIYTDSREYKAGSLLTDIENMLPQSSFLRVHRQYIVNISHVSCVEHYMAGRYSLYLDDDEDTVLFSGRSYASMIKQMFKIKA